MSADRRADDDGTTVLSLRLPSGMAAEVAAIAHVEGRSKSKVMTEAIAHLIEGRRGNPAFQEQARSRVRADIELLKGFT